MPTSFWIIYIVQRRRRKKTEIYIERIVKRASFAPRLCRFFSSCNYLFFLNAIFRILFAVSKFIFCRLFNFIETRAKSLWQTFPVQRSSEKSNFDVGRAEFPFGFLSSHWELAVIVYKIDSFHINIQKKHRFNRCLNIQLYVCFYIDNVVSLLATSRCTFAVRDGIDNSQNHKIRAQKNARSICQMPLKQAT